MHIVCPNCGTSYDVQPAALGPAGRTVRCVRCRETWLARVDDMARADALVEAAEEIGWDSRRLRRQQRRQALRRGDGRARRFPRSRARRWPRTSRPSRGLDRAGAGRRPRRAARASGRRMRKFAFGSGPAKYVLELQPADRDRRHGGAGAGADRLAQRRRPPAAADRGLLPACGLRREPARPRLRGRAGVDGNRRRQQGVRDRGRHQRRPRARRSRSRGCASSCRTRAAPTSMRGTRWSTRRLSSPAKRSPSARALPRRRPTRIRVVVRFFHRRDLASGSV